MISYEIVMESIMSELGNLLKSTREEQKKSMQDVVDDTRIRENFIKIIEEGRFKDLPSYLHAYGFVKKYAEFLNLDYENVVWPLFAPLKIYFPGHRPGLFQACPRGFLLDLQQVFHRRVPLKLLSFFLIKHIKDPSSLGKPSFTPHLHSLPLARLAYLLRPDADHAFCVSLSDHKFSIFLDMNHFCGQYSIFQDGIGKNLKPLRRIADKETVYIGPKPRRLFV